jgi:N-acetylglucosamine malate deacetylase 1
MVNAEPGCDALFFGAHPDDVELFAGGTVAALTRAGHDVVIADLTAGELASNGTPAQRREESVRAAALLGARNERPVLSLPDGGLDPHDPSQLEAVVRAIRVHRPRLLIGPWPDDRHPDHVAAGELIRRAVFFAGVARHAPAAGGVHRPLRTLYYPCHHDVRVDLLVDVTDAMSQWQSSLEVYASQFVREGDRLSTQINRPGFLEAARGRRAHWGNLRGVHFAEAFVHDGPWVISLPELLAPGERT